jgi:hypothetical protein
MARKGIIQTKASLRGVGKVQRKMMRQGKQGINAFRAGMYAEALHLIDEVVLQTPDDKSGLRNSHFVTHPGPMGEVRIGFGAKYAAWMEYVGSLSSSKVSEKQRRAAFAAMREGKWKRSVVGFAPGFFRQTIRKLRSGQVARIKKTEK